MSNQQGLRQRKSHSNGPFVPTAEGRKKDIETDTHQKYEFGGPPGVVGMMVGFPMLMCLSFFFTFNLRKIKLVSLALGSNIDVSS